MSALTETHVNAVCLPGQGSKTCRYLVVGSGGDAGGWICGKLHEPLAAIIDVRVESSSMTARGDNCEGRDYPTLAAD
jgi:hypothetical protein